MIDLTLADLLSIAGAVPVTMLLVEVLKRTAALPDSVTARFLPLVSLVVGSAVVEFGVIFTGSSAYAQGILTGVIAGGTAAGIYDAGKSLVAKPKA